MFETHRIAVVVPAFNAGNSVRTVVATLPAFVDAVIVVDDGSDEGVASSLAGLERPGLAVVEHAENLGVARAIATGFRHALAAGAGIIVKMDADGQMDPDDLPRLLTPITAGRADLVKGNRFMQRGDHRSMPALRKVGNLTLSFLAKVASGYWNVFDPTNGYVALRRELVETISLDSLGPRYFFEISLLVEAYLAGAVVVDVPMAARYRDERSSLSIRHTLVTFPGLLIRSALRRIGARYFVRDFTAVSLCLVAGAALLAFGTAFGLYHWMLNRGTGLPTPVGTIVIALLPWLAGFQLLLQAFVMDVGGVPTRSPWASRDAS